MNAITAATSLTAAPLWERTRAMFARASAAIGDAATIAALRCLSSELRRRIIAWLCPLEHIVRKLLLAEAAALRKSERVGASGPRIEIVPLTSPGWTAGLQARTATTIAGRCAPDLSAEARRAKAEGARSNLDLPQPHTWSASFSFALPRDPFATPESRAPRIRALCSENHAPPKPLKRPARAIDDDVSPLRLARRFEALRRVLENPFAHAERLARLLARAVRRFPEIVKRYFFTPARTGDYDPDDPRLSIDALGAALHAPEAFPDSS